MEALIGLAIFLFFGSLFWLIYYLKQAGAKNLRKFAAEHGLAFTRDQPPVLEGKISGRPFQYAGAFTMRKGIPFEFWSVEVAGRLPQGLAIFPSGFFSSFYPFPEGSLAKKYIEELRSRVGPDEKCVVTGDKKFDRNFFVTCDNHDAAQRYLTPERRKALLNVGDGGFLFDGALVVEREQSAVRPKVMNKRLAAVIDAASVLDGAVEANESAARQG